MEPNPTHTATDEEPATLTPHRARTAEKVQITAAENMDADEGSSESAGCMAGNNYS